MNQVALRSANLVRGLNGICAVLTIAAVFDYFFLGHRYRRAQIVLLLACVFLVAAAIVARARRSRNQEVNGGRSRIAAPYWIYVGLAACPMVWALALFTNLLRSNIAQSIVGILFVVWLTATVLNRKRANAGRGVGLTRWQVVGILLGVVGIVLAVVSGLWGVIAQ